MQQFEATYFIMHLMDLINFHIRCNDDVDQKKVVSKLTTESREEAHKLTIGAMQYMRLIIIQVNPTDEFKVYKNR